MTLRRETSVWAHMIVAAAISSAASSLAVIIVDPEKFNWTHDGLVSIGKVAVVGMGIGILGVLKQSPLPRQSETAAFSGSAVRVENAKTVVVEEPKQ